MNNCKRCGIPTLWRDLVCTECKREDGLSELEIMRLSSPASNGSLQRII